MLGCQPELHSNECLKRVKNTWDLSRFKRYWRATGTNAQARLELCDCQIATTVSILIRWSHSGSTLPPLINCQSRCG
jgi:hypothetical protein